MKICYEVKTIPCTATSFLPPLDSKYKRDFPYIFDNTLEEKITEAGG